MSGLVDRLWHRGYRERLHQVFLELIQTHGLKADSFCDLGVGDGVLFNRIKNTIHPRQAVSCDLDACPHLSVLDSSFVQTNFNQGSLPFRNEQFDLISNSNVIEHLFQPEEFLLDLKRILKPNGKLLIATNNMCNWTNILSLLAGRQPNALHASDYADLGRFLQADVTLPKPELRHRRLYALPGLEKVLELHGFRVLAGRNCVFYPFSGFLERMAEKVLGRYSAYIAILAAKAA